MTVANVLKIFSGGQIWNWMEKAAPQVDLGRCSDMKEAVEQ